LDAVNRYWKAVAGGASAGPPYPFRRMSPGVGLRPPPPPLLRLQGHGGPAFAPPASAPWHPLFHRQPQAEPRRGR